METSFLALYRGETVSGARIVALSADPQLVRDFATRLLESPLEQREKLEASGDEGQRMVRVIEGKRGSSDPRRGETR